MKLLAGPFGWECDSWVSISLIPLRPDEARVRHTLAEFGCYPPAIDKIVQVMQTSNRYDCLVQRGWIRVQHDEVRSMLWDAGVCLQINYEKCFDKYRAFQPASRGVKK